MRYKWPVMGHLPQLETLENDLIQDRLSHAYLFAGPKQIGKMLVARTFAQILQCPNDFCRECHTCQSIEKGQHIDTIELRDIGESLKIDQVRELISHLSTTTSSRYKIVLLQNLERITGEAANAFLKNLEEPIPCVIFIFTTTQPQQLLDTLVSRMRFMAFHALPESAIMEYLQRSQPKMDAKTLSLMATFSIGKPGRAMNFLNDPEAFRVYQDMYHQILKFLEKSSVTDRLLYVENIAKDADSTQIFLELFLHVVRGFLMKKIEGTEIPYSYPELFGIVDHFQRAQSDLQHNVNDRLVLEQLMMTF